jgi:hypothetical protein
MDTAKRCVQLVEAGGDPPARYTKIRASRHCRSASTRIAQHCHATAACNKHSLLEAPLIQEVATVADLPVRGLHSTAMLLQPATSTACNKHSLLEAPLIQEVAAVDSPQVEGDYVSPHITAYGPTQVTESCHTCDCARLRASITRHRRGAIGPLHAHEGHTLGYSGVRLRV